MDRMVKVRELNAFITETPDECQSQLQSLESEPAKNGLYVTYPSSLHVNPFPNKP